MRLEEECVALPMNLGLLNGGEQDDVRDMRSVEVNIVWSFIFFG